MKSYLLILALHLSNVWCLKPDKPVVHELSGQFTPLTMKAIYPTVIRDHIQREIESAKGKLIMLDADELLADYSSSSASCILQASTVRCSQGRTYQGDTVTTRREGPKVLMILNLPRRRRRKGESGAGEGQEQSADSQYCIQLIFIKCSCSLTSTNHFRPPIGFI